MNRPLEEDQRLVQFISAISAQLGLVMRRKQPSRLAGSEERFRS